jgi:hypothetical protein
MKNPNSPSEITAEWLESILFPKASERRIASIEIDKNFGPWSLLGKAVRVLINYIEAESEPKSMIVKFQVSASEPKKEGEIYKLLSEAKTPFIPKLYGVFGEGNLVLEDLSPAHSVLKAFDENQAREVISILAEVNSQFWGDTLISKDDQSHFVNSININFEQSWDIFKNRYQEQLGKEIYDFQWIWKNADIVSTQLTSDPIAFNHGDVNRGNLLFPNDGSGKPMLIDWQLAGQKTLPFDLSYFLIKSLNPQERRKHEDMLIRKYYQLLPEQIRSACSFDRLMLNYRACVTRSMLSAVTKIGPKFASKPDQLESADKLAAVVIEAVKDHKPVEAIEELRKREWLNG